MKLRKKFTARPTPLLSYVLGVMLGDGFVHEYSPSNGYRQYRVGLYVKDKAFAEKFAKVLTEIGLNPHTWADKRGRYQVRAVSVDFYEWYRLLSLEQIRSLIGGFEDQFVCGFYESEGSIGMHNSGSLYIRMSNQRKELLSIVQAILRSWDLNSHLYGPDKTGCFTLGIYGNNRAKRFLSIVKPCIKTEPRKQRIRAG